jgi:hypothetical protein
VNERSPPVRRDRSKFVASKIRRLLTCPNTLPCPRRALLACAIGNYAICPVSGHAGLIQKARCQVLTDFCHAFGAGHCA